ncbi:serine/Arginine-related protein 53-like [Hyperolius riggenbachi]|uniref:serine/Arginine-related protein 53-like n=1 Tax=Hyperolius riggenbachi TaxID=752182 RepID=UPI0035A26467
MPVLLPALCEGWLIVVQILLLNRDMEPREHVEEVVINSSGEGGGGRAVSKHRSPSKARRTRSKSRDRSKSRRSRNRSAKRNKSSRDRRSRSRSRSRRHRKESSRRRDYRSRSRSRDRRSRDTRRRRSPNRDRYSPYRDRGRYDYRSPKRARRDWDISPQSEALEPFQRPIQNQCWSCSQPAMPDKRVCEACFAELGRERDTDNEQVLAFIQQAVRDTFQNMAPPQPAATAVPQAPLEDPLPQEDSPQGGFSFALVPAFLSAIKSAIDWQEEEGSAHEPDKYYPHLDQQPEAFPFMKVIREVIMKEWSKVEQKASLNNRFSKLYPLKQEDAK